MNQYVKIDHDTLKWMRRMEAQDCGIEETDPAFGERATVSKHYGDCPSENGEPYFYLAEYLPDFTEINLFVREEYGQWLIHFNGINTMMPSKFLTVADSERILADIFIHQIETAVRTSDVLASSLGAGDYLYNRSNGRLMLSCYRHFAISENGFFAGMKSFFENRRISSCFAPKAEYAAFQLLQLLTHRSKNQVRDGFESEKAHLSFPNMSVFTSISTLIKSGLLTDEEWAQVASLIQGLINELAPVLLQEYAETPFKFSEADVCTFEKRVADAAIVIQAELRAKREYR